MNPRDWWRFIFGTDFKRRERQEAQPTPQRILDPSDPDFDRDAFVQSALYGEVFIAAPPTNRGDNE